MVVLYFILGAFARRWYGGMFPDDKYKILGNRGLQTAFMLVLFLSIYVKDYSNWLNWLVAIAVSCWLQFQFWSRGHGACFDIGRDVTPSPQTLLRYNERWYHRPCDWLFEKVFKKADKKWGFLYDFLYMGLRYTCPMLPMMIFDWRYILIGLSVSPIYAFNHTLYEKETWIRPQQSWLNISTKWSEIIVGGVVYAGCYLLAR